MSQDKFYVYVYIDPRNHQEFYYGKGKDDRKLSHLKDSADSEKSRILAEIKREGLDPIIRVIARGLSQDQALLVEKTLIWKLGKNLTNRASGHFADKFRPHDTLHKELFNFDFANGIYCINIGEGVHRNWDDCKRFGFISAGQNWNDWGRRICSLRKNDILCAYLSKSGYVGIARVIDQAVPATTFRYQNKPLSQYEVLTPKMFDVPIDPKDGEFLLKVKWIAVKERQNGVGKDRSVWRSTSMLGSLEKQTKTLSFLEKEFAVRFNDLLKKSHKNT